MPSKKSGAASSNWLALQKVLKPSRKASQNDRPQKRRKIEHSQSSTSLRAGPSSIQRRRTPSLTSSSSDDEAIARATSVPEGGDELKNGESLAALRKMIFGQLDYSEAQKQPGKYLALDCEMVGVGPEGVESSLARVSIVNFFGAVLLDVFVRQRERVVDYRTEFSGVREADMVHAKPFLEVQAEAAALLKDKILVGHAVHNDLKALLLTHPRPYTRDTQVYAGKFKVAKSRHVALRHLVKQEVGATIQGGEHSSVTDARATMAVFRLYRKQWEVGTAPWPPAAKKQEAADDEGETLEDSEADEEPVRGRNKRKHGKEKEKRRDSFPGGGRKGVSSGLSVVVKRGEKEREKDRGKRKSGGGNEWWKELGGSSGSKGSMRL
ncbi:Exonuclease domain-containing protein [Mycena kentingensis (nom. inval.)]|nr:Exonuclease domain-containing protein [Mycena kentingensis (nom. inval.)]